MATNPDKKDYFGSEKLLVPNAGMLRFVLRDGKRILQRYEWSHCKANYHWFDLPLVDEETGELIDEQA